MIYDHFYQRNDWVRNFPPNKYETGNWARNRTTKYHTWARIHPLKCGLSPINFLQPLNHYTTWISFITRVPIMVTGFSIICRCKWHCFARSTANLGENLERSHAAKRASYRTNISYWLGTWRPGWRRLANWAINFGWSSFGNGNRMKLASVRLKTESFKIENPQC